MPSTQIWRLLELSLMRVFIGRYRVLNVVDTP